MQTTALIFGITGQDGFYLSAICSNFGVLVHGVSRANPEWITGDVSSFEFVEGLVSTIKPDYIFHLAADSSTAHRTAFQNHQAIATGSFNILEAAKKHAPGARIFLSGSALQFENNGRPIIETDPFVATSIYVAARNYSVFLARYYRQLGLKAYVGYFFHHDSPYRKQQHLNKKIVDAAKRIANGENVPIEVGDPDVIKEFNFAGDLMEAIWVLVNQDAVFEAVIGSGKGYKIAEWIDTCASLVNKDLEQYVRTDSSFRPEFASLVSDPATMHKLGWQPKIDIRNLAAMMLSEAGTN